MGTSEQWPYSACRVAVHTVYNPVDAETELLYSASGDASCCTRPSTPFTTPSMQNTSCYSASGDGCKRAVAILGLPRCYTRRSQPPSMQKTSCNTLPPDGDTPAVDVLRLPCCYTRRLQPPSVQNSSCRTLPPDGGKRAVAILCLRCCYTHRFNPCQCRNRVATLPLAMGTSEQRPYSACHVAIHAVYKPHRCRNRVLY